MKKLNAERNRHVLKYLSLSECHAVTFRNNDFIQALRQLELMQIQNRINTYGVQNSTMDDVFLKIITEDEETFM